uniref:Uncharacterized protein n=1 Tax=Oryza australiensis TaxID=4532 RepID=A0A1V1H3Q4_9ORYZ|nr:hypothetical protein [Oryza australiensis]
MDFFACTPQQLIEYEHSPADDKLVKGKRCGQPAGVYIRRTGAVCVAAGGAVNQS